MSEGPGQLVGPDVADHTFDPAYKFDSLDEFAVTADQIATVEVKDVTRGPQADAGDEQTTPRVLHVSVIEPIKAVELGATYELADGMYSRIRDRESGEFGPETLALITQGVQLEEGSRAVIGVKDGELLSMGVFPLSDGNVLNTNREGFYSDVEALSESEFIESLKDAVPG